MCGERGRMKLQTKQTKDTISNECISCSGRETQTKQEDKAGEDLLWISLMWQQLLLQYLAF